MFLDDQPITNATGSSKSPISLPKVLQEVQEVMVVPLVEQVLETVGMFRAEELTESIRPAEE